MGLQRTPVRLWASALLLLAVATPGRAQLAPSIPPDVQAIMQKLRSGKPPTPAEQKRLQEWATSQAAAASGQVRGGEGAKGPAGQQGAGPLLQAASGREPRAMALSSLRKACPAAGAALPAAAPTAPEYVALLDTLVKRYGARLDPRTKAGLDGERAGRAGAGGSRGGSYGALLNAAGAVDEAVYAAAFAARKDPADLLAANNLGVDLSEAGEHRASAQVLLYVAKQRPGSPLAAVNLGWTYFNAGAGAAAQKEFQRAQRLAPDMAGPEAGLGLLAGCRGDVAGAARLLRSSLDKGYSKVAAVALGHARAARPGAQGGKEQESSPPDSPGDAAGSGGDELIPDLPLQPEPERNLGMIEPLQRAGQWAQQRSSSLQQRYREAAARVQALNRRARLNGDAIELPVVFDRELFEFGQAVELTFTARFRNVEPTSQQLTQVMNTNAQQTGAILLPEMERLNRQQEELIALMEELVGCGNDDLCKARVEKKIDAKKAEMEETSHRVCLHSKQSIDVSISSGYKHWKVMWDDFRPAAADLYAFTNPILKRVWVPSLHELLQLQRELTVMSLYHPLTMEAAALAESAEAYRDLKCVPPQPPGASEGANTPNLPPEKKADCPFEKPVSAGCGLLSMTLGCDQVTISGGEVLRFKVNRNFKTHETTVWGGVGASAEAKVDFLGPMSPKAELTAQAGFGARFGPDGSVGDVFVTSELTAGAGMGGRSVDVSVSGQVALEGGASLSAELPGGLGGTVGQ